MNEAGSSGTTARLRTITPKPLTPGAFAPYGEVIEAASASETMLINEGHTTRFHDLAKLDLNREQGWPLVSIFRSEPRPLPIEIRMMERHPVGSQAFIPLSDHPYLVVVARDAPDNLEAFLAQSRQGVNYGAGTWHHYSLALEAVSDFLVIDRGGPGENLEEVVLAPDQRCRIAL